MLHSNTASLDYHYFRYSTGKTQKSVLGFERLLLKPLATLNCGSLSTRLLCVFKIAVVLNLQCVIAELSQVLILIVTPLTNMIFKMLMVQKSLFVERALKIDKTSEWAGFPSLQIALIIESSDSSVEGLISSPRTVSYSLVATARRLK